MSTCNKWLGYCVAMMLGVAGAVRADVVDTPYGAVSVPLQLGKVPGENVFYVVGRSGVPGPANEGHTSNAGFVVTPDGVVVFDTLGTPALGYRLLQTIRSITSQPIRVVVISHYHADHVYGLQAFVDHAGVDDIIAQERTAGYRDGDAASQGEDAQRRLAQRRAVLFPWVDRDTRIVAPTRTFGSRVEFEVGGVGFEVRHLGPAHAPGDAIMLVRDYGVLFSGDLVYKGRIPYLDSPHTDVLKWLDGLDTLAATAPQLQYLIPGHGEPSADIAGSIAVTRDYIEYLVEQLAPAVQNFESFDEAYAGIDWSAYADMPAFKASNRGNAFRVYLELEARSFQ